MRGAEISATCSILSTMDSQPECNATFEFFTFLLEVDLADLDDHVKQGCRLTEQLKSSVTRAISVQWKKRRTFNNL